MQEIINQDEILLIEKESLNIQSNDDLNRLNLILRNIKKLKLTVTNVLNPRIEDAHKAHKGLTELKKKYLKPLEEVESKINQSLKQWTIKQEEEAKLLQEKINKQLAEEADKIRQQKIKEAEEIGSDWLKEVAKEEALAIVPQTIDLKDCKETVAPKQEGQYKRSNWKARIVSEEIIPRIWLMPNMTLLEKRAKELKVEGMTIPGVEFYDDFTIVTKV